MKIQTLKSLIKLLFAHGNHDAINDLLAMIRAKEPEHAYLIATSLLYELNHQVDIRAIMGGKGGNHGA